jgi:hypothetical protein
LEKDVDSLNTNNNLYPTASTVNVFSSFSWRLKVGFSTSSLQVESVTPERAQQYLSCNFAHNRPLRKYHVAFLASEMREGRFMSTAEIHLMYRNGEPVLVNGQHTCSAIVQYGKPVRVTVRKTLATESGQIAMAYAFGHDTGLRRTFTDGVGAYNLEEATNLRREEVSAVSAALRHIRMTFLLERAGYGIPKVSVTEIVDKIYEWAPYAKLFFNATMDKDKKLRSTSAKKGSLSIALVTFRYAPEEAFEFWAGIFLPDDLVYIDPRQAARRVLEASKGRPGTGIDSGVTTERLSRQLARCWKAYLEKEPVKQMPRIQDETAAIIIPRTPYTGRHPKAPWWPS